MQNVLWTADALLYFARAMGRDGHLQLKFVHDSVQMTNSCNLSSWSSVKGIDDYLHLKGELLREAHYISNASD